MDGIEPESNTLLKYHKIPRPKQKLFEVNRND